MPKITIREGASWLLQKLRDHTLGLIPDEGQLEILTQRMTADRDTKRAEYHAALKDETLVQDPEHPEEGSLPRLRAKRARREEQGTKWGKEFKLEGTPALRKTQLTGLLKQCSDDCDALDREIGAEETLLATKKETTALRRTAYQTARDDLTKLQKVAPAMLAQTKALKDAERQRLDAVAAGASGSGSDAGDLLKQLEDGLAKAKAGNRAAKQIELEETTATIDLDAVDEEESRKGAADERVARWTK